MHKNLKHIDPDSVTRIDQNMVNFIYLSKELISFHTESIDTMVAKAAGFNASVDICGFLYYYDHYFVQYLEGEKKHVEPLMHRIEADERHEVIVTLKKENIKYQKFPGWHMENLDRGQSSIQAGHVLFQLMEVLYRKTESVDPKSQENVWNFVRKFSKSL